MLGGRWFGVKRLAGAVALVATVTLLSGCAAASASSSESDQAPTSTAAESTSAATTPFEFSLHPAPATTASTTPSHVKTEQPVPVSPLQPVPAPQTLAPFTVTLNTHLIPPMTTVMYPKHVEPGTFFELDEPPGCTWQTTDDMEQDIAAGTIPAGCDWSATSAWKDSSPYPESPSKGRVDVAGHNCIHHEGCGFTGVAREEDGDADPTNDTFNVTRDDTITETTSTGQITLQVCGVGPSKKHLGPGEKSTLPTCVMKDTSGADVVVDPDIMIGTCENEKDPATGKDISDTNIFIAGKIIASQPVAAQ